MMSLFEYAKPFWIFFYVFPVSGSGGVPYLKIVNFQSEYRTRVKNLQTRLKIDLYLLTFIKILKENLLQMVREVTIKINLYAQKRIPSIAIKNSSDTVCTYPTGSSRWQQIGKRRPLDR